MVTTDAIVKKALRQMHEEQFGDELSPQNIALYATKKLDLPITRQEVESAMQRKLSQELQKIDLDEYIEDYGEEVMADIREAMAEQHIDYPLQEASDFNRIDWSKYSYSALEVIHRVLYIYGAPDLLYN